MDVILGALGGLLGGLWCLLEGFWAVFGAMLRPCWRPWGRFWGLWEPLGAIFEALALFGGASGGFQRFPKRFYRFQEIYTVFFQVSIYVISVLRFSQCFRRDGEQREPRWRAKRAPSC